MPKEGNPQVFICLDNKLLLQSFFLPNNVSAAVFFISSGSSKQFNVKEKQPYFSTNAGAVSLHFQLHDYRASCNDWQNPVPWMSLFLWSQISAHWTHMEVLTRKTALWKWWMEEGAPTGCGGGGGAPLSPRSCHHHTLMCSLSRHPVQNELHSLVKSSGFFLFHSIDIRIISYKTKIISKDTLSCTGVLSHRFLLNSPRLLHNFTVQPSDLPTWLLYYFHICLLWGWEGTLWREGGSRWTPWFLRSPLILFSRIFFLQTFALPSGISF